MKPLFVVALIAGCTGVCWGDAMDRAIIAAMKLSEQPNYSWSCTVSDDAQTYDIEGKTQVGGYTWLRMPTTRALARRLGRDVEPMVEGFFKDNEVVLWTSGGWRNLRELPRSHDDWIDEDELVVRGSSAPSIWNPLGTTSASVVTASPMLARGNRRHRYTNAQFGVSRPHEELAVIVCSHTSFAVNENIVTGTLSNIGAQLLLVRDGQKHLKPLEAAGVFELTIVDGMVSQYALRLEGILKVDRRKIHVRQFSRTTVKFAGTTRFDVPAEVRFRLGE